jgi:hypothetical protein
MEHQILAGQVLVSGLVPKILNTDKERVGKRRGQQNVILTENKKM